MPSRARTPTLADLPVPAPLPSLSSALSRRSAIFGAVTIGAASVTTGAAAAMGQGIRITRIHSALDAADARLVALADAYEAVNRQVNATLSTAPGYGDLVDASCTIEDELADTPAETMAGVLAKARVMQFSACRDCNGADIGGSIADDVVRLHAGLSQSFSERRFAAAPKIIGQPKNELVAIRTNKTTEPDPFLPGLDAHFDA